MSKGLEALYKFCDDVEACINSGGVHWVDTRNRDIVEKELKALEIIKSKKVNVLMFLCYANSGKNGFKMYNQAMENEEWQLIQEEYELLKEVLL